MNQASRTYWSAIVLTMAIGIGSATTIFSAVDAVLLRQLPYAEADELVQVFAAFTPRANMDRMSVAPANFVEWQRATSPVFAGMAAFRLSNVNLIGGDLPERLRVSEVTPNLFDVLGAPAAHGRSLVPADAHFGNATTPAVISDGLWTRRFNRDPGIIGGTVKTSSGLFTVVGVMPPPFRFPIGWIGQIPIDVWTPLTLTPAEQADRRGTTLNVVARLANGVSMAEAQAFLNSVTSQQAAAYPETNRDWSSRLMPLAARGVENVRPMLLSLLAAVAALLIIACANSANLMLARGLDRHREMALRTALGARRIDLIRQLIAEAMLASSAACVLGVLIAVAGTRTLAAIAPVAMVPELAAMSVNLPVLAAAVVLTIVCGIGFSVVPALVDSRVRLRDVLQEGGRHGDSRQRRRLKVALAVGQTALTLLLLVSAVAVARAFAAYMSVDPGFNPDRAIVMRVSLPSERYPKPDSWRLFFDRLEAQAGELPGVLGAALAASAPMENAGQVIRYRIVGQPVPDGTTGPVGANLNRVSPHFMETSDIQLRSGRWITGSDSMGSERVALVNEAFVHRASLNSALGQQIVLQGDINRTSLRADASPPLTIVGVVADVKEYGRHLMTPPTIYLPLAQDPQRTLSLLVRARSGQQVSAIDLRSLLQRLDPELAPMQIRSLDELVTNAHAMFRFITTLLVIFAAAAVLLSLFGIFGLIAYTTSQRSREWAVRQALGATPRSVAWTGLKGAGFVLVAGITVGCLAAPGVLGVLTPTMKRSMNVDIPAETSALLAACATAMFAAGLLASLPPIRRVARRDPLSELRGD